MIHFEDVIITMNFITKKENLITSNIIDTIHGNKNPDKPQSLHSALPQRVQHIQLSIDI